MTEKPFLEIHAGPDSQLGLSGSAAICTLPDTDKVKELRLTNDYVALGKELKKSLRYREAALAYTEALEREPDNSEVLMLRGGMFLSTLQCAAAKKDYIHALECGADKMGVFYRLGLCAYYTGDYAAASDWFTRCYPLCDGEMGIAAIYWQSLSAYRNKGEMLLLKEYRDNMDVGHHTAYRYAVRVFLGTVSVDEAMRTIKDEKDGLEQVIEAYGVSVLLKHLGRDAESALLCNQVLKRDDWWIAYSYIAAWNDNA
jgi:tetratricopeptide (TPR) repeat protein